ncbi:MAG: hypothetical protein LBQ94_00995, partial [Treponema sp.]|nr:hypothetical protein [Treponema sp.]
MMNKPDLTKIAFSPASAGTTYAAWQSRVEKETGKSLDALLTHTMEQIDVKPLYTEADYESLNHIGYTAGMP